MSDLIQEARLDTMTPVTHINESSPPDPINHVCSLTGK